MTIPFLSFFKRKSAAAPAAETPLPPLEKPSSERLSKTVMPNATRTVGSQEVKRSNGASYGGASSGGMATAPAPAVPRTVAFASTPSVAPARSSDLPPAVALALEPRVERAISLTLGDVVSQLPAGCVRSLENSESDRRILLKALELERGMATGRPTVSLETIYQQVPEIFLRTIEPSDPTQVALPFQKVLEQFTALQVRGDQHREQVVPQVETPFLKVTLEDDSKFGTSIGPIQTGELPPVRLQPATAEAIAAAEPEPAARESYTSTPSPAAARFPLRFPVAPESATNGAGNGATTNHAAPAAPARIPFKLSPKGTDAPAPERVPASDGPSVPTSVAPAAAPAAPTRIPFKITPPSDDVRPAPEPWLTKESFEADASAEPSTFVAEPARDSKPEVTIALVLKPILRSLAPFQLTGDISKIPDDARLAVRFSLLEPQLASGRIVITPEDFSASLPEEFRGLFDPNHSAATIALPLHEVLQNLPSASLRMRDDQIEQEAGENFATPFSAKAEEDAKRFKIASTPVPKPVALPEPEAAVAPAAEALAASAEEPSKRTTLEVALEGDGELDAKSVVARVGELPGVQACAIMFADGLSLAGTLPEEFETEGLCAMAPSLSQRIQNYIGETKLGALRAMTFSCERVAVCIVMNGNLCLVALHSQAELAADVRELLARAVRQLSKKYSNPV